MTTNITSIWVNFLRLVIFLSFNLYQFIELINNIIWIVQYLPKDETIKDFLVSVKFNTNNIL